MQHEIAVNQSGGVCARAIALEHPQQVAGVTEVFARGNGLQTLAQTRMCRDDNWNLRGQSNALSDDRVARIVCSFRIEGSEGGDGRAQYIHRMRCLDGADDIEDRLWRFPRGLKLPIEFCELWFGRQFAA